jgi:TolA-binding protein
MPTRRDRPSAGADKAPAPPPAAKAPAHAKALPPEKGAKRRGPAAPDLKDQIGQIEGRLAKLEELLATVKAQKSKTEGENRLRLVQIEKLVTTRIASTRASLQASLDRMGTALLESKKNVEREVGLLTRGLRAGVRAGRDAFRKPPPS